MMETEIYTLRDYIESGVISESDDALIGKAAGIIARGGLLAFPTETVYGLGGSAFLPDAAKRIYLTKGRPSDNPLIVHIASMEEFCRVAADIPDRALGLAESFWPGPLTMVLHKSPLIPSETTGGLDTVAVRMPSHPVARRLISLAGVPVAAPSANISGRPSTTSGAHCEDDLMGRIEGILDAGPSGIGLESTIVDMTGESPLLLRPGAITLSMLTDAVQTRVSIDPAVGGPVSPDTRPRAPGMKYRHYAPKASMVLVLPGEDMEDKIQRLIKESLSAYSHIALLCSRECAESLGSIDPAVSLLITGSRADLSGIAAEIFSKLRTLDSMDADFIIAEGYPEDEIGLALMNRLKKASGYHTV